MGAPMERFGVKRHAAAAWVAVGVVFVLLSVGIFVLARDRGWTGKIIGVGTLLVGLWLLVSGVRYWFFTVTLGEKGLNVNDRFVIGWSEIRCADEIDDGRGNRTLKVVYVDVASGVQRSVQLPWKMEGVEYIAATIASRTRRKATDGAGARGKEGAWSAPRRPV